MQLRKLNISRNKDTVPCGPTSTSLFCKCTYWTKKRRSKRIHNLKTSTSLWVEFSALIDSSVAVYNEKINTTNPTQSCLLLGQLAAAGSALPESIKSYEQIKSSLQSKPTLATPEYAIFLETWQWPFPMEAWNLALHVNGYSMGTDMVIPSVRLFICRSDWRFCSSVVSPTSHFGESCRFLLQHWSSH